MSRVCGPLITFAEFASAALGSADVFGAVALRRTPSLDLRYFMAEGSNIKYVPYLGCGLIRNPKAAKKGNF